MPSMLDLVKKFVRVKFSHKPDLAFVILYVTSRCNLKCKHCFYWEELNKPEIGLSLDEIRTLSASMPKFEKLSLTGGEPFVRADLPQIAECFVRRNGVQHISICTNGTMTRAIVDRTKALLLLSPDVTLNIAISFDGTPETNDVIRARAGVFQQSRRTYDALKKLRECNTRLTISATLTANSYNQSDLLDCYNMLKDDLGLSTVDINYLRGSPKDTDCSSPDLAKFKALARRLQEDLVTNKASAVLPMRIARMAEASKYRYICKTAESNAYSIPCYAGLTSTVIYDNGDVYFCEILKKKLGNIREGEGDFSQIWLSSQADDIRDFIMKGKCFCTHECYQGVNVIMSERWWPRMAWNWVRSLF